MCVLLRIIILSLSRVSRHFQGMDAATRTEEFDGASSVHATSSIPRFQNCDQVHIKHADYRNCVYVCVREEEV